MKDTLKVARAIESRGGFANPDFGWMSGTSITSAEIVQVLTVFDRYGLTVPAAVSDVLQATASAMDALAQLEVEAPPFVVEDLALPDYQQRFAQVAAARAQHDHAKRLYEETARAVYRRPVSVVTGAAPELAAELNKAYLAHPDDPDITAVHNLLLRWGPQPPLGTLSAEGEWCLQYSWLQPAWNRLVTEAKAGLAAPRGMTPDEFALSLGAERHLAASRAEAQAAGDLHREAWLVYKDYAAQQAATGANTLSAERAIAAAMHEGKVARAQADRARDLLALSLDGEQNNG